MNSTSFAKLFFYRGKMPIWLRPLSVRGKTGPKKMKNLGALSLAEWGFDRKSTARRRDPGSVNIIFLQTSSLSRKFCAALGSSRPATMVKAPWESEQA
jgi:hypothetical protein